MGETTASSNEFQAMSPTFVRDADPSQIIKKRGRYLPHWTLDNGVYHVRFRLCDSLPIALRDDLIAEKRALLARIRQPECNLSTTEKRTMMTFYSEKVETLLDAGHGCCWLKQEPIARLVTGALDYFNLDRYRLWAWSVMPNHVHVVVQPLGNHKLGEILKSWKSYTAHKANKLLGRTGRFWLPENFDRLIRSEEHLLKVIEYVFQNPRQAGLRDWEWVGRE